MRDKTVLGILLLAHGGPGSLQEVPAFLKRLRGGRPPSPQLLEQTLAKYRALGGASPLPGLVARIAHRLQEVRPLPVHFAMLHWNPLLDEVIPHLASQGLSQILAICLVPHFSDCSVGRYRRRTLEVARECGLAVDFVESWHTLPPYVEGLAQSVLASWRERGWEAAAKGQPESQNHLVFCAHSLPKAALPPEDPYQLQLRESAELVAGALGLPPDKWTLAFQNAADSGEGWLGPQLSDLWPALAERGVSRVTLCPLGSVVDQAEVLFDLDLTARREAKDHGLDLARTPLLNDAPALINSLASLVDRWAA